MIEALAEALRRTAAEERHRAAERRRMGEWVPRLGPFSEAAAAECDARAQVYEDWARAVMFPGGPIHADWFRYGVVPRKGRWVEP